MHWSTPYPSAEVEETSRFNCQTGTPDGDKAHILDDASVNRRWRLQWGHTKGRFLFILAEVVDDRRFRYQTGGAEVSD
jgi:hypothetical protein